ncbi:MAG: hypothetical protein DMG60_16325 [Acidobacteria bacterium]|nr:MAG: hypothetical protein DMG60_16325 [Acidobacteriota bacterium]
MSVANASGVAITPTPTVTYTSADPSAVTVTSAGLVCAGVFDSNSIVCQTKDSSGNLLPDKTVNVTVTSGGLTATVPVYVHSHVDNITVSGPSNPPVCVSQNQTELFTAKVFSNQQGKPVDITANVGPLTWSTGSATVATVDQNGVITSRQPGATTVVAAVANTTGTPAVVVACSPRTISLHLAGVTDTTFSVATGTAQTLAADVTDILGRPITNASLTFSSYVPSAAAITSAGAVTTPGAGVTTFVASCVPPGCNQASGPNINFNGTGAGLAMYSNAVIGTVTGTTATTIYVTGSDKPDGTANTSLIPIDSSANTAGTAITLSGSPNSMVFDRTGSTAYLGSSVGMLIFDPGTNAVTATASGITGVVLKVSNDGNKVVISDTSAGKVFVFDKAAQTAQTFDLAGVTAADFDSDNSKAYFTSGSAVYEYSPSTGIKTLSLAADGVAFTPQAAVAYLGGSSILGLTVCNDTPASIAVASDDSNAFLTAYSGGSPATGVPFYHFADGSTGAITLVNPGGVLFSGGLTQDAHSLYVGTEANGSIGPFVHRIDLTAAGGPADANQISVSFNPRIVVVRPK